MAKTILILNGPNLNLLGRREPDIYGHDTLDDIKALCDREAERLGLTADFRQSNHEGELIDWIQEAMDGFGAVILNAGGYTHTSIAIHDALKALPCPVFEVHLSDPEQREPFRHFSFVGLVARQSFTGMGAKGYVQALEAAARLL
ncbi:type II 3-dehydroquinate dehydratase [Hyphobacterium marinum]|uniref:3-dehydroquinate dehydratase n=1 Tax=Hyphobacterium marinum TaxID=3116574 RepID=A0ABU7M095_9PROT|nr:type II 3-dehydroquinate dehydratase [Hyphobacterium sp. Y6023]MEE2567228.1 type II 3-dehydroquinate dehydratase [Hyphobacterium sp. Y6023]